MTRPRRRHNHRRNHQRKRRQSPVAEVERLLQAIEPFSRRRKLLKVLNAYFEDPERCDGRGRKSSELEKVATTLRHIVGMQRWIRVERYDLNVRRRIRDFLKHIDHNQPWPAIVDEGRKARGLANLAGRTWNERKEYGAGRAADLGDTHASHPLNTVSELRRAGRHAGNCLRDNEHGYHDKLRSQEAEFHEVTRSGVPVAWLRVDPDSRTIEEIFGPSNEKADLPVPVLWLLCRNLDVSADHLQLFLQNGVLALFLDGKADAQAPGRELSGYRFWWRSREIVMYNSRNDRWSRFVWRGGWRAAGPSDLGTKAFRALAQLVPAINRISREARPFRRKRPKRRT